MQSIRRFGREFLVLFFILFSGTQAGAATIYSLSQTFLDDSYLNGTFSGADNNSDGFIKLDELVSLDFYYTSVTDGMPDLEITLDKIIEYAAAHPGDMIDFSYYDDGDGVLGDDDNEYLALLDDTFTYAYLSGISDELKGMVSNGAESVSSDAFAAVTTAPPVTTTPVPATMLLFGSGMLGIAGLRMKNKLKIGEGLMQSAKKTGCMLVVLIIMVFFKSPAQATIYTFTQAGFTGGEFVTGWFEGSDSNGDGWIETHSGEITGACFSVSGGSTGSYTASFDYDDIYDGDDYTVEAFQLVYLSGSGTIGDDANFFFDGITVYGSGFVYDAGTPAEFFGGSLSVKGMFSESSYGGSPFSLSNQLVQVTEGDLSTVPAPATIFLLGTGLLGLAGFRKKNYVPEAP